MCERTLTSRLVDTQFEGFYFAANLNKVFDRSAIGAFLMKRLNFEKFLQIDSQKLVMDDNNSNIFLNKIDKRLSKNFGEFEQKHLESL